MLSTDKGSSEKDYRTLGKIFVGVACAWGLAITGAAVEIIRTNDIQIEDVKSTVHKIDRCAQSFLKQNVTCDF